jgi:pyrroline-5-carboxylate reductase
MFGKHNNISEKKTYESAIEAVETFFDRISRGTETYPEILEHLRTEVDTTEKAVEALRFVQHGMRSLIQQAFAFNQSLERDAQDLEKKPR